MESSQTNLSGIGWTCCPSCCQVRARLNYPPLRALASVALLCPCSFQMLSTEAYCMGIIYARMLGRIRRIRVICLGEGSEGSGMLVQGCPRMGQLLLRWPSCLMNGTGRTAAWSSPAAAARPSCRPSSGLLLTYMKRAGCSIQSMRCAALCWRLLGLSIASTIRPQQGFCSRGASAHTG